MCTDVVVRSDVVQDASGDYDLDMHTTGPNKRPIMFGATPVR
ncbi:MAG TPA: hypothetical protein VGM50_08875 [Gemmatimonadaceae bacterium]